MDQLEFIKSAYAKGKVKDVSQAFEEFPPEEECHGGKIGNVFNEEHIEYGPYSIGNIIFVKKYKYSNGTVGFAYFFVIISQNNMAVSIESFGMLLSAKLQMLFEIGKVDLEKVEEYKKLYLANIEK